MTSNLRALEKRLMKGGALVLLTKPAPPYSIDRAWGEFDPLRVRAIDDLWFDDQTERSVLLYESEPPHAASVAATAYPAQVALERVFFHIASISGLSISDAVPEEHLSPLQRGLDLALRDDGTLPLELTKLDIAELIGRLEVGEKRVLADEKKALRALLSGAYFEAFARARAARSNDEQSSAWWIELFALTFLGLADEALSLYEVYPFRGAVDAAPQLIAARFRVLLKQFNEARTILQTLSFGEELQPIALVELSRSYLMSGEYDRALDIVRGVLNAGSEYTEARLVQGLARRGISYDAGDTEGLSEALGDFEWVAKQSGVHSAEALFHAGTVLGRLGRLEEAELYIRQSLFQRDRTAARDALIRILCARGRNDEARGELEILALINPASVETLREVVEDSKRSTVDEASNLSPLWSADRDTAHTESQRLLNDWKVPVQGVPADLAVLDAFINYYAPAGYFSDKLEFSYLNDIGLPTVARVLALHAAYILETSGVAPSAVTYTEGQPLMLALPHGGLLPLEGFMHDRILIGASGDNLSSLESLLFELQPDASIAVERPAFWREATAEEVEHYSAEASWCRSILTALGGELRGGLRDFAEIDRIVDLSFDPAGELKQDVPVLSEAEIDRFISGVGFVIGTAIAELLPHRWFSHPDPAGIALEAFEIGLIFPAARAERRILIASGADYGVRFSSLALSCAAARALFEILEGDIKEPDFVVKRLRELDPAYEDFSSEEVHALAGALLSRAD